MWIVIGIICLLAIWKVATTLYGSAVFDEFFFNASMVIVGLLGVTLLVGTFLFLYLVIVQPASWGF